MAKAPVYREKGCLPTAQLFENLVDAAKQLDGKAPADLMSKLWAAIEDAKRASEAKVAISRGSHRVGYGVSKEDKAIACDAIMSIVRQIKSSKAW